MGSKAGSTLVLIGGILTIIIAIVISLASIFLFNLSGLQDKIGREVSINFIGTVFIFVSIFLLFGGILKIYASRLMLDKKRAFKGSIIAVILGVIISDLFCLIGGIIGLIQGNKR